MNNPANDISVTDLQSELTAWANETFPLSTVKTKILHLWEELDESHRANEFLHDAMMGGGIVSEEIADAGLILMHLASQFEVELPPVSAPFVEAIKRKLEVCKARKWDVPDANGVVHHVEDDDI